jgi:hypothetical protein
MWLSVDVLEAIIETEVRHKCLLSIHVFCGCFQVQLSEILDGWAFCYRRKGPKSCCFLVKSQFLHVLVVWTSDLAPCLYSEIVLFIDFVPLELLLTFFISYLVFILCACRMNGPFIAESI